MNTTDEDVERYLKLFSLLSFEEIEAICVKHAADTAQRYGQEQLAYYVTQTIFGNQAAEDARLVTRTLFGGRNPVEEITGMDETQVAALRDATGGHVVSEWPTRVPALLTSIGLTESNGEAKQMIKSGSVYINEEKVTDLGQEVTADDLINGALVIRKGKKQRRVVTG